MTAPLCHRFLEQIKQWRRHNAVYQLLQLLLLLLQQRRLEPYLESFHLVGDRQKPPTQFHTAAATAAAKTNTTLVYDAIAHWYLQLDTVVTRAEFSCGTGLVPLKKGIDTFLNDKPGREEHCGFD